MIFTKFDLPNDKPREHRQLRNSMPGRNTIRKEYSLPVKSFYPPQAQPDNSSYVITDSSTNTSTSSQLTHAEKYNTSPFDKNIKLEDAMHNHIQLSLQVKKLSSSSDVTSKVTFSNVEIRQYERILGEQLFLSTIISLSPSFLHIYSHCRLHFFTSIYIIFFCLNFRRQSGLSRR